MKTLRLMIAFAVVGLTATALQADDHKKDKEMPAKAAGCCTSAEAKGEKCSHSCCVEADKAGNNCERCKGTGKKEKKPEEAKHEQKK
jgi:hypothetical protein